jgi:hypothetical protein
MAVAVIALGMAHPTQTMATPWQDFETVLPVNVYSDDLQATLSDYGEVIIGWTASQAARRGDHLELKASRIQVAIREPGQPTFGSSLTISARNARDLKMAAAGDGTVFAAWQRKQHIEYAVHAPGDGFTEPQRVGSGQDPEIAVGANGAALICWQSHRLVKAVIRESGATFTAPRTISNHGSLLACAAGAQGEMALAWKRDRPRAAVFVSWHLPSAGFSRRPVPGLRNSDQHTDLGISAAGETIILADLPGNVGPKNVVASIQTGAGTFSPLQRLSRPGHGGYPALAVDGQGNAFAAWQFLRDATPTAVDVAVRPTGGRFSQPIRIAGSAGGDDFGLEANKQGQAVLVWNDRPDGPSYLTSAGYSPASGWSGIERVSSTGQIVITPALAVNSFGTAVTAWNTFIGGLSSPGPSGVFTALSGP